MPSLALTGNIPDSGAEGGAFETRNQVYIIDDDREVRRSIHCLLSTADIVSWPFGSAADFLESLDSLAPAPILLDIRMRDIDGIQLMQILRNRGIEWPIIVITAHGAIEIAVRAIKLGAIEFLEKPFGFDAINDCLKIAFGQLDAIKAAQALEDAARGLFARLTPREMEVLRVWGQGFPNKIAAHHLSLSVRTVEMHRANALAKLKVKSIAEVVRLARDAGLDMLDIDVSDDDAGA